MPLRKSKPKPPFKPKYAPVAFEAIGTAWFVELYETEPEFQLEAALLAMHERIETFDQAYSRFRDDSLVSAMARAAGTYRLPDDAAPMFKLYRELYDLTNGAMTPLVGQLLSDAGYDAQYSLQEQPLRMPPAWEAVMTYDFPQLTLQQPALLDVGAMGKGYLVDLVGEVLADHGARGFCIDAGGDILYRRPDVAEPLRVGLEHPSQPGQAVGVAELLNQSLCGSAGNRRRWGRFHHIMNPHTLSSPEHLQAVWVTAKSTLLADALTTALYFISAQTLSEQYTFEYGIVHQDYSLEVSPNFPAKFFINESTMA